MVPVARAGGGARARDIARSAIGRMAAESIWVPASLLPARGVRWEARGEDEAVAHFEVEGEPVALALGLDAGGAVRRLALARWGDVTPDGRYAAIPFGANVTAERRFAGYTIPSEVAVAWWFGTDRAFEFFRATLDAATFEPET